jgi:cytoskeleton protein RodZ
MTKGTFGETLKREREMRGVTLDEIAGATRIASRFLRAIENEEWDQLPGGVFNRGFVRSIARYLGLDEENTVAEYVLAVDERQNVPVWTGRPPAVTPEQPWLAWIIAAIIIFALLAGGWLGVRRLLAWRAASRAARAGAAISAPLDTVQQPEPSPVPQSDAAPLSNTPGEISGTPSVDSAPAPAPAPSVAPTVATDSAFATAPSSPETGPFKLKIEAGKETDVTVDADSKRVFQGPMKAGQYRVFRARNRFEVSSSDAGAVLLEMNGKMLAPIGPPDHAGTVTITRDSLKAASGGQN